MTKETDREKEAKKHLNQKQQSFALNYVENHNITQSAISAGYSKKTASVQGCNLLKNTKVREYIDSILERIQSDKIANIEEVMEYLTRVMRGEEKDSFDMEPSLQERTKAANALADRLDNRAKKLEIKTAVTIIDDIPDDAEVEEDEED
jgi:phage terminase small subunit|nr:MAG TPA: Terminase small subunit [Caudoviricetes sp.]